MKITSLMIQSVGIFKYTTQSNRHQRKNFMSYLQKKFLTISIIAVVAVIASSIFVFNSAFSQEFVSLADKPTIKVTGDASLRLQPDQAVIIIDMQSRPSDLTTALDDQKQNAEKLVNAIKVAVNNDPKTTVVVGQTNLNPFYTGQVYSDVNTFAISASTSVETDLDNFSKIIKRLTEEKYGFESVYASPYMLSARQGAGVALSESSEAVQEEAVKEDASKQITINVAVNTKPDTLNNVLDEYEQKYNKLLTILQEMGIPSDKIKPANVNISPMYYGPGKNTSYSTFSQIIVKTDSANVAKISEVARNGEAYIENTFLSISDSTIENARDKLNKAAFENAQSKAESLAKMAGLKLKGVQSIETVTNPLANPYGGVTSYKGLYVVPPYYYQNLNGEIATSITVEFEIGR